MVCIALRRVQMDVVLPPVSQTAVLTEHEPGPNGRFSAKKPSIPTLKLRGCIVPGIVCTCIQR